MRVKRFEMASDQLDMGLKWGGFAPKSTRITENESLRQQRSCARWVFPQPARPIKCCRSLIRKKRHRLGVRHRQWASLPVGHQRIALLASAGRRVGAQQVDEPQAA
jgi:hypothetical protein